MLSFSNINCSLHQDPVNFIQLLKLREVNALTQGHVGEVLKTQIFQFPDGCLFTDTQILDCFLIPLKSHPTGLSRNHELSTDPAVRTHQPLVSLPVPSVSKQEVNATFTKPVSIPAALNALHSQIITIQQMRAYNLPSVLLHCDKKDPSLVAPEPNALMCPRQR